MTDTLVLPDGETDERRKQFAIALMDLAAAFGHKVTPLKASAYMKAMADVPIGLCMEAIPLIVREEARFPSVRTWRQYVDRVLRQRQVDPAPVKRSDNGRCERCWDTSWAYIDPATGELVDYALGYDQRDEHGYHWRVRRCPCWVANPARSELTMRYGVQETGPPPRRDGQWQTKG